MFIKLTGVGFSYKKNPALADISLKINKGESLALIGPNGSGKSTLLKLLNGIILADTGEFYFDNEKINRKKMMDAAFSKRFHSRVGFLMQNSDAQLFCSNVYEEAAFAPRQMGLSDEDVNQRVLDTLDMLHLTRLKHREPYHLSEGEKKKTALAAILTMNPEVLVLDEPMNGLDPKTKHFLRELIQTLHQSGKTILCSTHDFGYVEGLFERAAVFTEEHTIGREGPFEEILADSAYLKEQNII